MPKFVLLWTDAAIWLMALVLAGYVLMVLRRPGLRADWSKVFADKAALSSSVLLLLCLAITLLDSVHYRPLLPPAAGSSGAAPAYDTRTRSLLDALLARLVESREATYSRPLSYVGFTKESVEVDGQIQRLAPRLKFGGAHLQDPAAQWLGDLAWRIGAGLVTRSGGCRAAVGRAAALGRVAGPDARCAARCVAPGRVKAGLPGAWSAGPWSRWVCWSARP